jgi:hypothetical protein
MCMELPFGHLITLSSTLEIRPLRLCSLLRNPARISAVTVCDGGRTIGSYGDN